MECFSVGFWDFRCGGWYDVDSERPDVIVHFSPLKNPPNSLLLQSPGNITQVSETYDVIGNMNEFQLTIGETTFGGLPQLTQGQKGAVMDYGNLIWTTLERSKSVQEALDVMPKLVEEWG